MLASSIDFAAMVCVVEIFRSTAVVGTGVGAIGGAFASFLLGRTWVFRRADAEPAGQLLRYVLVASASLGLNALGEHVLVNWAGVGYVRARVGVAVLVSNLWNYPLHKHFVFGRRPRQEPRAVSHRESTDRWTAPAGVQVDSRSSSQHVQVGSFVAVDRRAEAEASLCSRASETRRAPVELVVQQQTKD
jgi:putative flippase GtrA